MVSRKADEPALFRIAWGLFVNNLSCHGAYDDGASISTGMAWHAMQCDGDV